MKHSELKHQLTLELQRLGIELPPAISDQVIDHLEWLLETNSRVNLTAVRDASKAVSTHIVDSLAVLPELDGAPDGFALDLGTGGGYPGIPLNLATGRPFTLLDSVSKKARALQEYVADSQLKDVEVLPLRSEQLARERRQHYAVVVARAVAPLPSLLELSSPLLSRGGRLIALKGQPAADEVESGRSVAALVGMEFVGSRQYSLPSAGERRIVFVYEKTGQAGLALPRREGLAQSKPLA